MKKNLFSIMMMLLVLVLLLPNAVSSAQNTGAQRLADPNPFLRDLRVRQAIAYCTNEVATVQAVYPYLTTAQAQALVSDSFLPVGHWAYHSPTTQYSYNPATGQQLLEDAGWTLPSGATYRVNASGQELQFEVTTTTAALRQATTAALEAQLQLCGIHLIRNHVAASWFFGSGTGLETRDFETAIFAWVRQIEPGGTTLYQCDQIPTAANGWVGQNYMGWCNFVADAAVREASRTLPLATRQAAYATLQEEMAKDVPSISLFHRPEFYAANSALSGFSPTSGEGYYSDHAANWDLPADDTIVLGVSSSQEPDNLSTMFTYAFSSFFIQKLFNPSPITSPNYTWQAQLLTRVPTLENGDVVNGTVMVNAGDVVEDADGSVTTLATGVQVYDANGSLVTFDGSTPIAMKQLTVTYRWRTDLKFSDGNAVSQEDFELGHAFECDPGNGSFQGYYGCERTEDIAFSGTNTTVTWVPGYQTGYGFTNPPYYFYPAHRIIASGTYAGQALANVPYASWQTLDEIMVNPMGAGPYRLVEWVAGDHMTFAANPYWYGGAPATPNIIIKFVQDDGLEAALISGTIDLIATRELAGLSAELLAAEAIGTVDNYVVAGSTWEHLDFNLGDPNFMYLPALLR